MTSTKRNRVITVVMILDSLPPLPVGGAEIQALRLGKKLTEKKIKIIYLTPGRDKFKGAGSVDGMPVYRLHSYLNYLWDFFSAIRKKTTPEKVIKIEYDDKNERTNEVLTPITFGVKLRYQLFLLNSFFFLLKNRKVLDLIHVHSMEWPSFIGASLSKWFRIKLIAKDATMNGITALTRYPNGEKKRKSVIEQAHFIAMTKSIYNNFLKHGVSKEKISQIPNGIDISDPVIVKNYRSLLRKVIFVGNLSQQPAKGVDLLLKAWLKVISVMPGAELVIIGGGSIPQYQKYLEKLGIGGSVSLLGKQSDIQKHLLSADLFVLPSRREGMPNALMEAMMIGLPCVATDISGCQDLIDHKITGLLIPPGNIEALSNAILYMMNNPGEAEKMGRNASEKIKSRFNLDIISDHYVELYRKLLQS